MQGQTIARATTERHTALLKEIERVMQQIDANEYSCCVECDQFT